MTLTYTIMSFFTKCLMSTTRVNIISNSLGYSEWHQWRSPQMSSWCMEDSGKRGSYSLVSVHSVNHYLALIVCQTLNDVLEIQQRRKCRPDFLPPESQGLVRDTKNKGMNSKHNKAYDKNKTKNSSRAKTGILWHQAGYPDEKLSELPPECFSIWKSWQKSENWECSW